MEGKGEGEGKREVAWRHGGMRNSLITCGMGIVVIETAAKTAVITAGVVVPAFLAGVGFGGVRRCGVFDNVLTTRVPERRN